MEYNVISIQEPKFVNHLPITTATTFKLCNLLDVEHSFFNQLFNKNTKCKKVIIDIKHRVALRLMEKITKVCDKTWC